MFSETSLSSINLISALKLTRAPQFASRPQHTFDIFGRPLGHAWEVVVNINRSGRKKTGKLRKSKDFILLLYKCLYVISPLKTYLKHYKTPSKNTPRYPPNPPPNTSKYNPKIPQTYSNSRFFCPAPILASLKHFLDTFGKMLRCA